MYCMNRADNGELNEKMELIAPCHFGLEAVLKREILDLGYDISEVEDGRVGFWGDAEAICRANIFLRTAERVLLKVGSFKATSYEELFENTRALDWENYIPENGKFWVAKAASVKSKLFSPSDIQSVMKKAMVRRMQAKVPGRMVFGRRSSISGPCLPEKGCCDGWNRYIRCISA